MPATAIPAPTSRAEREAVLERPGGRRLSYALYGAPAGPVVVVLDGPGSRGLARAGDAAAAALGVRLVAPDRPGFFDSTMADRAITDWPEDHAALLDALGAERAGIIGQSGGTPYALAAATALPERTIAVAFAGALTPFDEPGALGEMGGQVRVALRLARRAPWLLRLILRSTAKRAAKDPEKAAHKLAGEAPPADRAALQDPAMMRVHVRSSAEILSRPEAIAREFGLLNRPWGVDPEAVTAPTALWVGDADETHPVATTRRLARRLGGAPVTVVPDAATFGLVEHYPDMLRFAAGLD
jgi:pimeloyl-ACP methyl ester carboxylesterase